MSPMTFDPFVPTPPSVVEEARVRSDAALLTAAADRLEQLLADATDTPWWFDESDQCWRLHGVAARMPLRLGGETFDQIVNHQILKAPKGGTTMAEYWPSAADGALLIMMVNLGPALVSWLRSAAREAAEVGSGPNAVALARKVMGEGER